MDGGEGEQGSSYGTAGLGHTRETEGQFPGGAGNCSRTTERAVIQPALPDRCSFCSISPSPQGGDRTGSLHNYLGN